MGRGDASRRGSMAKGVCVFSRTSHPPFGLLAASAERCVRLDYPAKKSTINLKLAQSFNGNLLEDFDVSLE
jgi:hypothetical protein